MYHQEQQVFILRGLICFCDSQRDISCVLHFMNHKGIQFQLQIFFTLLLKKKKNPYILTGLRVSKLTANFHFGMNYPFNVAVDKQLRLGLGDMAKM